MTNVDTSLLFLTMDFLEACDWMEAHPSAWRTTDPWEEGTLFAWAERHPMVGI